MASYTVIILPNTPDAQHENEIRLTVEAPPLPSPDTTPAGADYPDVLEQRIIEFGVQIQRELFAQCLNEAESKLCEDFSCHDCGCNVARDGHTSLKIATRFGVVNVDRQVLECKSCGKHFIPLNSIFPEHNGMVITRGLQELACLLSIFMSYRTAQRLLGWFCHDGDVLSAREVEELVNQHGAEVRKQEMKEINVIESSSDPETIIRRLNEVTSSRQQAWPKDMKEAIGQALEDQEIEAIPFNIPKWNWDRVQQYVKGKEELTGELDPLLLANLGPRPKEGEVVIFADGVVVHGRGEDKRPEETIVVLRTLEGERYFSGSREDVIRIVTAWVKPLRPRKVTIIGDGAQWIREGLYRNIAGLGYDTLLILDWYHLRKKVTELLSMVCNGKKHRDEVMGEIQPLLWAGKVDEAIEKLLVLLPQPRNRKKFNELISYLEARKPAIQDYDARKRSFEYNGNGIVEKANDLLVARRQKAAGMSWSREGSDTLCALTTLWYNGEWGRYWVGKRVA